MYGKYSCSRGSCGVPGREDSNKLTHAFWRVINPLDIIHLWAQHCHIVHRRAIGLSILSNFAAFITRNRKKSCLIIGWHPPWTELNLWKLSKHVFLLHLFFYTKWCQVANCYTDILGITLICDVKLWFFNSYCIVLSNKSWMPPGHLTLPNTTSTVGLWMYLRRISQMDSSHTHILDQAEATAFSVSRSE